MLGMDEWQMRASEMMHEFDRAHDWRWQVGMNGRSGGYVVLYQGGQKDGRPFAYPGKSVDQGEMFGDWDMDSLRERVRLVQQFDDLVVGLVLEFFSYCASFAIETQTVDVPTEVKVLVESGPTFGERQPNTIREG